MVQPPDKRFVTEAALDENVAAEIENTASTSREAIDGIIASFQPMASGGGIIDVYSQIA